MSRSSGFEVQRFEAAPAHGDVAVVELEGAFAAAPPRRPRLLVERGFGSVEVPAATVADEPWTATFAVALDDVADPSTTYSLIPGRGPVFGLPSPTGMEDEDRYVRLARSANELRHRLNQQTALAEAARERVDAVTAERDELDAELERAREALTRAERRAEDAERTAEAARAQRDSAEASASERVQKAEQDATAAREELERVRGEVRAAEERATTAERDREALGARADAADRAAAELREQSEAAEARATDLEQQLVMAEDEVRAARRELRDTKARLEAAERSGGEPIVRRGRVLDPDDETLAFEASEDEDADTAESPRSPAGEAGDDRPRAGVTANGERRDDDDDGGHGHGPGPVAGGERGAANGNQASATPAARSAAGRGAVSADRTRATRVWDDPAAAHEDVEDEDLAEDAVAGEDTDEAAALEDDDTGERPARRPVRHATGRAGAEVLDPASVGARHIEPSQTLPPFLTPARLMVGVALLLLFAALIAILLGAGLV
jgi:hypothetical protein